MPNNQQFFNDNGYIISKKIISLSGSDHLYKTLVLLAKKYQKDFPLNVMNEKSWEGDSFNNALIALRKNKPEIFGAIYDSIQNSAILSPNVCNESILKIVSKILECDVEGIAVSGVMMRMDAPNDNRNRLKWHQENSYYPQNLKGENGVTLWSPLHNFKKEYGSIELCIKSHKTGKFEIKKIPNQKQLFNSEQYEINSQQLKQFEKIKILIPSGDALFFNMDLIHRSGYNSSNKFRFSIGARFHKMLTNDFMPGRNYYEPNMKIGRLSNNEL